MRPSSARILSRLRSPPPKVNNFEWFNGKPIRWQKVKVLTSKQNAPKLSSPLLLVGGKPRRRRPLFQMRARTPRRKLPTFFAQSPNNRFTFWDLYETRKPKRGHQKVERSIRCGQVKQVSLPPLSGFASLPEKKQKEEKKGSLGFSLGHGHLGPSRTCRGARSLRAPGRLAAGAARFLAALPALSVGPTRDSSLV